ncbi:MAG: lactonase family protein [Chloroflexi bacterium]|nr:lactonase family protein [Chloroflexota bacterium]
MMTLTVYVGCYTTADRKGRGEGITAYRMDEQSGEWTSLGLVARTANPSFLTRHPNLPVVYCVHGGNMSEVSAFAAEADGHPGHNLSQKFGPQDSPQRESPSAELLRPLGRWPSGGANPVHLDFHASGRWLVVANYTGATAAVLPVQPSGELGEASDIVPMVGTPGPHPVEQSSSHPHHIPFDRSSNFIAIPDKGLDCVFVFRIDLQAGRLRAAQPASVASAPGAGPRHIAFHPSARWAYVINELNSTITSYAFEERGDGMRELQTVPSVPGDVEVRNTGSEVVVHPTGRWVYVSNRGHNSVGAFEVHDRTGMLAPIGWYPTQGDTPRAIALDPDGRFLYAANQSSDTIVTFRVDERNGTLAPTGQVISTGSPSTMVFVR